MLITFKYFECIFNEIQNIYFINVDIIDNHLKF